MEDMLTLNEEYKKWLSEVGKKFKNSQIKAAVKVNEEMLYFYYWLGGSVY